MVPPSLIDASLIAIALAPTERNDTRVVYGRMEESPLTDAMAADLAELADSEGPSGQKRGSVAMLQKAQFPSGRDHWGIDYLIMAGVSTIHQELGALIIGIKGDRPPSPGEEFALATLANQAAVSLENTRFRRESIEGAERLGSFNRLIRAITSGMDLEAVFRLLSSEVRSLLPHDRASIALADPGGQTATVYGTSGQTATLDAGTVIPINGSNVGQVIASGMGMFKTNIEQAEDFLEKPGLLSMGIRSNLTVPMWDAEVCIGSLNFGSFHLRKYGSDDLPLAQRIADQIAVAIVSVRERKDAEQALHESVERFRDLYEDAPLCDFSVDIDGTIRMVNRSAVELLGYARDDLIGRSVLDLYADTPLGREKARQLNQRIQAGEEVSGEEMEMRRADGKSVWVSLTVSLIRDSQGQLIGRRGMVVDVTERKRAEEILLQQTRELTLMEERNRFARELHDTFAQGFMGVVLQLEAAEEALDKRPSAVPNYLARAQALARDCLQEARRSVWDLLPQSPQQHTLDIVLEEEVQRFSSLGREEATFSLSGERRTVPSNIQTALLRICQEALANVRKHAGGTEVWVDLSFQPDAVRLVVRDNGIGFDVEAAKHSTGRSGFGLTSMEQRARLLGGSIDLKSQRGNGTLVEAWLPTP